MFLRVKALKQLDGNLYISDFEAFADAAEEFHPHILFYATFNPKVSNYYLL